MLVDECEVDGLANAVLDATQPDESKELDGRRRVLGGVEADIEEVRVVAAGEARGRGELECRAKEGGGAAGVARVEARATDDERDRFDQDGHCGTSSW